VSGQLTADVSKRAVRRLCRLKRICARQVCEDDASDFPFAIELGEIYEGPLDLLLDLIRSRTSTSTTFPSRKSPAVFD